MTTIAYLGPAGTFTEQAVWNFDLPDPQLVPVDSPAEALNEVRAGRADYAVVAVENSVDGAVTATTDALAEAPGVQIYGETELEIAFAIMTRPGASLVDASHFATHPVAYQQVKRWMAEHAPNATFHPATSNGAAAQLVAEGEADVAAAPERAAELLGLEVHARGVADLSTARTRFVLVGPSGKPTPRTGNDRTSIVFQTPNEPGTLVAALQEFAFRGVHLSRIESRPTRKEPNTYSFHVDIVGHIDDTAVAEALRAVYLRSSQITYLGSWPCAQQATWPSGNPRLAEAQAWVDGLR